MPLDVRSMFILGIVSFLVTKYYLERQMKGEEIFWLYSLLSALLGLLSAYTVVVDSNLRATLIPLTVVAVTLATLYYRSEGQGAPGSS